MKGHERVEKAARKTAHQQQRFLIPVVVEEVVVMVMEEEVVVDGILDRDSTAEMTGLEDEEEEEDKHVDVVGTAKTTTEQREKANMDDV